MTWKFDYSCQKNQNFRALVGLSADSKHESRILVFSSFLILYTYFFDFYTLWHCYQSFSQYPTPQRYSQSQFSTKKQYFANIRFFRFFLTFFRKTSLLTSILASEAKVRPPWPQLKLGKMLEHQSRI